MSEGLKPCPFCGGEARQHAAFARGASDMVGVYVECDGCGACSKTAWGEGAQERSAAAWNRRAERTCRIEVDVEEVETDLGMMEVREYWCSECYGRMADDDDYCPSCGARVMSE